MTLPFDEGANPDTNASGTSSQIARPIKVGMFIGRSSFSKEIKERGGELIKTPSKWTGGQYRRLSFGGLDAFRDQLAKTPNNAFYTLGTLRDRASGDDERPGNEIEAGPCTIDCLRRSPDDVAKTKAFMKWPSEARGLALFDHDDDMTPEQMDSILAEVLPGWTTTAKVRRASTSSGIHRSDGSVPQGVGTGHHTYFVVQNPDDLPRFAKALNVKLWFAGHGHIKLSAAGSALVRTIVDMSVFSPERAIFEAAPTLMGDLHQHRLEPEFFPGNDLDTRQLPDPTPDELLRYKEMLATAKEKACQSPEGKRLRRAAVQRIASETQKRIHPETGRPPDADTAKRLAERALSETGDVAGVLSGDFVLHFDNGSSATADEVLTSPERFAGMTMPDPIEPEYGRGKDMAKLFLNDDGSVIINSFAHGGRKYRVEADLAELTGELAATLAHAADPSSRETPPPSLEANGGAASHERSPSANIAIPDLVLDPPGFVGRIAKFAETRSIRKTPLFAVATALMATAVLTQNHFSLVPPEGGLPSPLNIFALLVADTGVGKEAPQRTLQFLLQAVDCEDLEVDAASEQGLMRSLAGNAAALVCYDEFGRHLKMMASPTGGHTYNLMTAYMKLYGKAFSRTSRRVYANKKDNIDAVDRPYVCLLALSTKDHITEAMTNSDVVDGTLNRIIYFEEPDPNPPFNDNPANSPLSHEDIEGLSWLASRPDPGLAMLSRLGRPLPTTAAQPLEPQSEHVAAWTGEIVLSEEAHALLLRFREEASELRLKAADLGPLWVRAHENALRVTGVLAAADAAIDPEHRLVASLEHAQYAITLVRWSIERQIGGLAAELSISQRKLPDKVLSKMWSWIDDPKGRFSKVNIEGMVPRAQVIKNIRVDDKRHLHDAIVMLVESGSIKDIKIDSATFYQPVDRRFRE